MAVSAEPGERQHGLQFSMYVAAATGSVRWRLLGGNNRDLGRGLVDYPDATTCLAGLRRTLLELPGYETSLIRSEQGRWTWRLRRDGTDMVGAGHPFDRRLRCAEACARFVRIAPTAEVRDDLAVLSRGGHAFRPRSVVVGDPTVAGRWPLVHRGSAAPLPASVLLPVQAQPEAGATGQREDVP